MDEQCFEHGSDTPQQPVNKPARVREVAGRKSTSLRYNTAFLPFSPEATQGCGIENVIAQQSQQNLHAEFDVKRGGNVEMASAEPTKTPEAVPLTQDSSRSAHLSRRDVQTLRQLLPAIEPTTPKPVMSNLCTVAQRIADYKHMQVDEVGVEVLSHLGPPFQLYLKECRDESTCKSRYSDATVRTYCHHAKVLLEKASALGLLANHTELVTLWKPIRDRLHDRSDSVRIIHFAIANGLGPADFTLEHLRNWTRVMHREKRSFKYVKKAQSRFRRVMVEGGYRQRLWEIWEWLPGYGVPFSKFPEPLRLQIERVERWKQSRYSRGRRRKSRHRAVSSNSLLAFICRLYGFCTGLLGHSEITSLSDFVTPDIIESFVEWY